MRLVALVPILFVFLLCVVSLLIVWSFKEHVFIQVAPSPSPVGQPTAGTCAGAFYKCQDDHIIACFFPARKGDSPFLLY